MNEKTQNKFYDWREGVREGNEDFVLISKGKEGWRYVYKKHHLPVIAMKVFVEKGNTFEEYLSFNNTSAADAKPCTFIIKDFEKIIFKDNENNLHPFGLKEVQPRNSKLFAYIKVKEFTTIIFASAEQNKVNIYEKFIDSSEDATTPCIFDLLASNTVASDSREVDFDEMFS